MHIFACPQTFYESSQFRGYIGDGKVNIQLGVGDRQDFLSPDGIEPAIRSISKCELTNKRKIDKLLSSKCI